MMGTRRSKSAGNIPKETHDAQKEVLVNKYRKMFVDKLTPSDLEELQFLLKNKFDADRVIRQEFLLKFEFRLRDYFHEEILTREMASIETLVEKLMPEDLIKKS